MSLTLVDEGLKRVWIWMECVNGTRTIHSEISTTKKGLPLRRNFPLGQTKISAGFFVNGKHHKEPYSCDLSRESRHFKGERRVYYDNTTIGLSESVSIQLSTRPEMLRVFKNNCATSLCACRRCDAIFSSSLSTAFVIKFKKNT